VQVQRLRERVAVIPFAQQHARLAVAIGGFEPHPPPIQQFGRHGVRERGGPIPRLRLVRVMDGQQPHGDALGGLVGALGIPAAGPGRAGERFGRGPGDGERIDLHLGARVNPDHEVAALR
jgi:hypothetical protein